MKKVFVVGLLCGVSLNWVVGCAMLPTAVKMPVAQALLVAESSADGVNHAAIIAAPTLHGAAAQHTKDGVDALNDAVDAAFKAVHSGDTQGAIADLNAALLESANLWKELHK